MGRIILLKQRFGKTGAVVLLIVAGAISQLCALAAVAQSSVFPQNQHLQDGLLAYKNHDYKKAIPELKAALDELKGTAGFETSLAWRVVVDNLGMAHGISGDLKSAKETFDYGLTKDPKYPMFHYNLACTFAEMNDRNNAIAELKLAFAFKANANAGEPMPNPATDSSFQKFMKDKIFLAALDEIRKTGRLFPDRLDFSAPGVPWILTIPADDFEIRKSSQAPDGKQAYFLLISAKTGITASLFIEPATKCTSSKSCRDLVRTTNLPNAKGAENVSSSEIGDISIFEYLLPSFRGQSLRQQNMYAEFVQDGFWIDLHISKVLYTPQDRGLFEALVRSVRFEKKN
jgi:tetratricopeptide (TPR) repeat protein